MNKETSDKIIFKQALLNNMYIIKMAYKICPKRVILSFLINTAGYIFDYYYGVIFMAAIFKVINKEMPFNTAVILIIVNMVLVLIFNLLANRYNLKYVPETDLLFQEKLNLMIYEKASDVEIECYEDTEFYNKYTRAGSEANQRVINMLNDMSRIVGLMISSVMIVITIIALDPLATIFIIFPIVFRFVIDVRANKARYDMDKANTPFVRAKNYVNRILYLEDYAKDIRLTKVFNLLSKNYNDGVSGLIHNYKTHGLRVAHFRALQDGVERVMRYPLMVIYAAARILIFKVLSVSSFVVLLNSIGKLLWSFNDITGYITSIQSNGLYIQNFRDFMEYKPRISQSQDGIIPDSEKNVLELKNVSYSYRGSDKNVLEDINITIRDGEKIALVGSNGAGKTTLIKLIMRLYDVSSGEILLNSKNIKEYNVEKYRDLYGTIFQDYKMFSMSVADNVMMRKSSGEDKETITRALQEAGIYEKIMENEKGLEQVLTREFADDGVVLSGGEFQKLAIARVFAKPCKIAILDEPSSALDPIAEYKVFESMKSVCENKTVIFISHRLSTAIIADRIYMMENGRIAESGTHSELMDKNGKYAEMFNKQSSMYLGGDEYEECI